MATPSSRLRQDRAVGSLGVSPDELAGLAEIMEMLGVSKRTAQKYAKRAEFPETLDRLASGPVWRRADVEAWGREHLPLKTGRPPKT
jgi:prophage regulatory protein